LRKKITIAIDGHSSCGKSTLAKDLAAKLDYVYIDSGAMYRAVALKCLQTKIDLNNSKEVQDLLSQLDIKILYEQKKFRILLDGIDITQRIIQIDVSSLVSEVAAISIVRKKLVEIQQQMGKNKAVVMDGRDIGTVVFPNAELKLFVTAQLDIRTQRRYLELKTKGMLTPYDEVKQNLAHRDHIDSTRKDSPLIQAKDAILIDNSYMSPSEQIFLAYKLVEDLIAHI